MNSNNLNLKPKNSKNNNKKNHYKSFKDNKPLKNIDNNTSYDSSDTDSNSLYDIKNNGSLNLEIEQEKNIEQKGKDNNINSQNRNTIAPFQGLTLNRRVQSQSYYNIFHPYNTLNINNSIIPNQFYLQQNKKLNEYKRHISNNFIYNQNINNNNLNNLYIPNNNIPANNISQNNKIPSNNNLLKNNIPSKNNILSNNIPQNNNLNQLYYYNLSNKKQLLNNNNPLLNNLNQQLLNNNLFPRPTNYSQIITLRKGFGVNNFNIQNMSNNNIQPRLTNIPVTNRYSLNNNISSEKERLIKGSKVLNKQNNYSKIQDNISKYGNTLKNNNGQNLNMNYSQNQPKFLSKIMNMDEMNLNNIANNQTINQQFSNQVNRPSSNSLISQINNNLEKSENKIDNDIINDYNKINIQTINNISNRPTINSNNNNFNYNNNINLQTLNSNYLKDLTNYQVNQQQNLQYNQNINSYLNEPKNNTNQTNQLLNNYNQSLNQCFGGEILLKDFGTLTRSGSNDRDIAKTNQDSYISKTNINGITDFNIFGVLDGHGPDGHYISELAAEFIPNYIINNPEITMNYNTESIYNKLRQNNYKIIKQAFIMSDNQFEAVSFDAKESGTTCVLVIHIGKHLICANVGDSRAIVAYDERNDSNLRSLREVPLSIDYKPDLLEEKSRIFMSGGVVKQLQNDYGMGMGPYRVFAPGEDYPGLAMSRSIGDLVAKKYGVIAEPGIREYNLNKNTKFVILCSDGVWEFLSNEKVKNIGRQFYLNSNASELCQELINLSVIEWKTNDSSIDDITAIALFF